MCTALNWKQPNFSVFFASYCGLSRTGNAGGGLQYNQAGRLIPANRIEEDRRCTSIREAVKFAKANNLLGVMLDATMLVRCDRSLSEMLAADIVCALQVQIPSLIQSAREHGLLITTFGTASRVLLADAHMSDGV